MRSSKLCCLLQLSWVKSLNDGKRRTITTYINLPAHFLALCKQGIWLNLMYLQFLYSCRHEKSFKQNARLSTIKRTSVISNSFSSVATAILQTSKPFLTHSFTPKRCFCLHQLFLIAVPLKIEVDELFSFLKSQNITSVLSLS